MCVLNLSVFSIVEQSPSVSGQRFPKQLAEGCHQGMCQVRDLIALIGIDNVKLSCHLTLALIYKWRVWQLRLKWPLFLLNVNYFFVWVQFSNF